MMTYLKSECWYVHVFSVIPLQGPKRPKIYKGIGHMALLDASSLHMLRTTFIVATIRE